jgi:hypothetical protein
MPIRYIIQSQTFQNILEGSMLSMLSIVAIISEADWARILGPHGVAVCAILGLAIVWGSGLRKDKREDERRAKEESSREARHAESIRLQKENADKLIEITVENIKAAGKVTQAITSMDRTIQHLSNELSDRPCQKIPNQ